MFFDPNCPLYISSLTTIVKWLVGLFSLDILPMEAARNRFKKGPPSAKASLIINESGSIFESSMDCIIFATAERTVFSMTYDAFKGEK